MFYEMDDGGTPDKEYGICRNCFKYNKNTTTTLQIYRATSFAITVNYSQKRATTTMATAGLASMLNGYFPELCQASSRRPRHDDRSNHTVSCSRAMSANCGTFFYPWCLNPAHSQ